MRTGVKDRASKASLEATVRDTPTVVLKGGEVGALVTLDKGSGLLNAARFREAYIKTVQEYDGRFAGPMLERHFKSFPLDDPFGLAREMQNKIVLGIISDVDGTLTGRRGGYDSKHFLNPALAAAINEMISLNGQFIFASAADIPRAIILLEKARDQVPIERTIFFAENGYAVIVPIKTESGYEYDIYRANMPEAVTAMNAKVRKEFDRLSEVSLKHGLFMFTNQDKEAQVTLELMKNGKEANTKVIGQLVVPYLMKQFDLPDSALKVTAEGNTVVEMPSLTMTLIPTYDSIEIQHRYLPSKISVRSISGELMGRMWPLAFGNDALGGNWVFIGFGDTPQGSDSGILNNNFGNVGFSASSQSVAIKPTDKLLDVIRKRAERSYVTLPAFSPDGSIAYGNGDEVAINLSRVAFTGTFFKVKSIDVRNKTLETILNERQYVKGTSKPQPKSKKMYTEPSYMKNRSDGKELMARFRGPATADTNVEGKIADIRAELRLK